VEGLTIPVLSGFTQTPELPGAGPARARRWPRALLESAAGVDPGLVTSLLLFLALVVPRLAAVPIWDSRQYYDLCLFPGLGRPFNPLNFNCFGHPSMLYMLLFAAGQWISTGSVVLLNLTNVALGCLAIAAFWNITGALWAGAGFRGDRFLATAILAVWPAVLANSLSMSPDYGIFAFFLLFVASLIRGRIRLAALFAAFLVLSKEPGVVLYGLATLLYLILFARGNVAAGRRILSGIREHSVLVAPALLFLANVGLTLIRDQPVLWGGAASSLPHILKRFVLFNPGEIFAGRFGPTIWILNMSWFLTACLFAAGLRLGLVRSARESFRSKVLSHRPHVFVLLIFTATTYALTRYETFSHARYLLAIAPFLILVFVMSLQILLARSALRYSFLGATFLLLLASDFRTIDPISKGVWGTFSFGKHELLKLTSWNNECCGYSMDQLVYNLEYLKFDEIQNAIFADIRPTPRTTFVVNASARLTRPGAVTREGRRTLRVSDTVMVRYLSIDDLERRTIPPDTVYFVAFPNFDNGPDFQRLRRSYAVVSRKSYERSGYAIPVYTMRHRTSHGIGEIAVLQGRGHPLKSR
jgi:hypothetical protein